MIWGQDEYGFWGHTESTADFETPPGNDPTCFCFLPDEIFVTQMGVAASNAFHAKKNNKWNRATALTNRAPRHDRPLREP